MKEWNNPYNPFNSFKVLVWREWLEGIVKGEFLPPVTVDTDPANACNYKCIWCNAFDYMHGDVKKQILPEKHLIKLADFYKEWGTHSTCIAGGGEPLMNPGIPAFLERLYDNKIESGIITNGSLLNDEIIEVIARTSRWCGISMDAATPETYKKIKGISDSKMFNKVIENIKKLTKKCEEYGNTCDVAYKYLLHPINSNEIYEAVKLAKSIGVKDFHMRPVGWDNLTVTKHKGKLDFESVIKNVEKQCAKSLLLEDKHFNFYGVRHKFQPNMTKKVDFSKCLATPLILTFGADGNCHLCFDIRGRKDLILCKHQPDPKEVLKHWGTQRHKDILDNIDVSKCPRCTFGPYNEIIEQVFMKDGMCRYFP